MVLQCLVISKYLLRYMCDVAEDSIDQPNILISRRSSNRYYKSPPNRSVTDLLRRRRWRSTRATLRCATSRSRQALVGSITSRIALESHMAYSLAPGMHPCLTVLTSPPALIVPTTARSPSSVETNHRLKSTMSACGISLHLRQVGTIVGSMANHHQNPN